MDWISIKDQLPREGQVVILTIHDTFNGRRELRYPVYYRQSLYSERYAFYVYGLEGEELLRDCSRVLAWMPMPTPYDEMINKIGGKKHD